MSEFDVLTQLRKFSERRGTPFIEKRAFYNELIALAFIKRHEHPKWDEWFKSARNKLAEELFALARGGVCEERGINGKEYLFLPGYFSDAVRGLWLDREDAPFDPFPDESAFGVPVPVELVTVLTPMDMPKAIDDPPEKDIPLFRLSLGDNGTVIMLPRFVKTKLFAAAIAKLRAFLSLPHNMDYCRVEMYNLMPAHETYVDFTFTRLRLEPMDILRLIEESSEYSYRFWTSMCACLRKHPKALCVSVTEDRPILQAADILDIYNKYYYEKTRRDLGDGGTMREIESQMVRPPFFYTTDMILRFTDKTGRPVSEQKGYLEMERILVKRSQPSEDGRLAGILAFGDMQKNRRFVLKRCLFAGVAYHFSTLRPIIEQQIEKEWLDILRGYRSNFAMKDDAGFETLVAQKARGADAFLLSVYLDKRLHALKKEMSDSGVISPLAEKFFRENGLYPRSLHDLLNLNRRRLLLAARAHLPLWYSVPFLVAIIRLLRGIRD